MNNITIPTTGLIYLFGVFVFFYLSIKFYRCYKEENNRIARLFSYSFFLIGLNYVVIAAPALFLIESHDVWRILAPLYISFVSVGWLLMGYAVLSSVFPKYSKVIGIFLFLIYLMSIIPFSIYTPSYFYIDGVLDWSFDMSSKLSFLFFTPFIATPFVFSSLIIIFFSQAKNAKDKRARIRSLGLGIAMSFMLLSMFTDFILITMTDLHPVYSDLNALIVFAILAFSLIFSWFPPKPKYVSKIE